MLLELTNLAFEFSLNETAIHITSTLKEVNKAEPRLTIKPRYSQARLAVAVLRRQHLTTESTGFQDSVLVALLCPLH